MNGLTSEEDILLVDDNPVKNLPNHPHNAIFPQSWCGDKRDNYLDGHLRPWLDGLFHSM